MTAAAKRWPDFFIVGAPRCGTSYLWEALREHPQVFAPAKKEPLFFCPDLNTGTAIDKNFFYDEQSYLALFRDAPADKTVGEGCVFNLFSTTAAERIHAVRPDAKIFICLRSPVPQMISFHAQRVGNGVEDLDFATAIDAEADRAQGHRLPTHPHIVPAYGYRALASYAAQVERYLRFFPRHQILVRILEDIAADEHADLHAACEFLGIDPLKIVDHGRTYKPLMPKSNALARVMRSPVVINAAKRIVPGRFHGRFSDVAERVNNANLAQGEPAPVDEALKQRLARELAPDVRLLGDLLGRDLSQIWKVPGEAAGPR